MDKTKTPKHVIILGAGASVTSGYPQAKDLRQWMASAKRLKKRLEQALAASTKYERDLVMGQYDQWIQPLEKTLDLFGEDRFGSVDEVCYRVRDTHAQEVVQLKKVLRLALGIHNPDDPEENSSGSDYHGFIQRIFARNDMSQLRQDMVVMSFNYDPYLESLLHRAVWARHEASRRSILETPDTKVLTRVTSGFYRGKTVLLEHEDEFVFLKLHGTIAWPVLRGKLHDNKWREPICWFRDFFSNVTAERLKNLTSEESGQSVPPILFPWEVFNQNGTLIGEDKFQLTETPDEQGYRQGGYAGPVGLYRLFEAIWRRARAEVLAASKISFVGISMHEYLNSGFEFLFKGKTGEFELVVTDHDGRNVSGKYVEEIDLDPANPPSRVTKLLKTICPDLKWNVSHSRISGPTGGASSQVVKVLRTFDEFIHKEMGSS